jgi:hypothetical protein
MKSKSCCEVQVKSGGKQMGKWVVGIAVVGVTLMSCSSAPAAEAAACPNEAFRIGPSAQLPDCRAYELATPADSNGRIVAALNPFGYPAAQVVPSELASPTRDSLVYSTFHSPLPDPGGATGVLDAYEAERHSFGWETGRRLTLPGSDARIVVPSGVSPDHLYSFIRTNDGLSPLSINGRETLYLGGPDGTFELVGVGSEGSEPYAQGRYLGEGGKHIVFSTGHEYSQSFSCFSNPDCDVAQLEPDAPPTGTGAIYDREADGKTRVVSLLPGNEPQKADEEAFYKGTSKDGSATAFEVEGTLYVRLDNQVTKEVAAGEPIFAGASDDGSYIFYVLPTGTDEAGVIHRFDTGTGDDDVVNLGDEGLIVNISGDGSHIYFISKAQLDGVEGIAGQPNLYVWSGGPPKFLATVLPSDLVQTSNAGNGLPALTNWTGWVTNRPKSLAEQGPGADSSRTTPDGTVLVIESRAKLTTYDNKGHTEIYRFEEGETDPRCLSCNFSNEADGDAQLQNLILTRNFNILHNVSEDGSRVFFETDEALVGNDVDGVNDIYEWQEEEDGESKQLISSGTSVGYSSPPGFEGRPSPNVLVSVTPDGSDVFFLSQDSLTPGAPEGGANVIYDAREGGGFAAPQEPTVCSEEACRPDVQQSHLPVSHPLSESLAGGGNVKPRKHHCRRAKHKRQRRCAKHRQKETKRDVARAASVDNKAETTSSGLAPSVPDAQAEAAQPGQKASSIAGLAAGPLEEFGIEEASANLSSRAAGSHPDFAANIVLNHTFGEDGLISEASARTEEVTVSVPAGLLGNINAVPRCKTGVFVAVSCPADSQVGITKVLVTTIGGELTEPVYNLEPPHPTEEVARLGFVAGEFPAFIDVKVRTAGDYGVTATAYGTSGRVSLVSAKTTLWGNPASSVHDKERLTALEANHCKFVCGGGTRPSTIPLDERKAFMTNPSACQSGQVDFAVRSYQLPGQVFTAPAPLDPITDCTGLPFAPSFTAEPTNHTAGAPTGLHTTLTLPQHLGEEERSTATMREARVTLPPGLQIAAGAANWIGTCSEGQVGYHREVDTDCPDSSKLGTATISSPALPEPIEGAIYQRNPTPGHQFGLWLTADALGLHVKLPGELEPDKATGRLTAVFRDLPQVPVSQIDLDVWGGPRAPLQNPDHCGTYTTDYSFSPHSNDPAASGQSTMEITGGCSRAFGPTLHAGVTKPVAGAYSPFVFDLNRDDGNQALRGFELHMPDGELAKIKGVPLCPDADAATGTCPAGSRIGSLQATAGPGPDPLQVPQPGKPEPQIYLAGSYKGAPFSIVSEVPAQAGPFDLGVLAVRSGLEVEPETGRAVVKADPLPQFFEGVGIDYRHIHAVVDRPEFSLNPTDCREAAVTSDVTSTTGTVAHPAARFQIDGCKALKFKPKLSLELRGGTKRADYPALTAILKARRGDANIASTSVGLPHSEFLAQEHIGTICTRKQFAADKCPKGSVYGKAKAWTPLLAKPLSGPVYLRSSDHPLPDLVAKLQGQLEIDLVGRIDSKNGGIRTTFESVPDAPVSKFVLRMKGGKKGLLTNSTDICRGTHKATVAMRAQNGRAANLRPRLSASACGKHRKGGKKR